MEAARSRFGDEAAADPFRGLYLSADQAASALDREAGSPLAGGVDRSGLPCWREILARDADWARLQVLRELTAAENAENQEAAGPEPAPAVMTVPQHRSGFRPRVVQAGQQLTGPIRTGGGR